MTICPRCGRAGDFKAHADGTQSVYCVRCLDYMRAYRAGTPIVKSKAEPAPVVRHARTRTNTSTSILGK